MLLLFLPAASPSPPLSPLTAKGFVVRRPHPACWLDPEHARHLRFIRAVHVLHLQEQLGPPVVCPWQPYLVVQVPHSRVACHITPAHQRFTHSRRLISRSTCNQNFKGTILYAARTTCPGINLAKLHTNARFERVLDLNACLSHGRSHLPASRRLGTGTKELYYFDHRQRRKRK